MPGLKGNYTVHRPLPTTRKGPVYTDYTLKDFQPGVVSWIGIAVFTIGALWLHKKVVGSK